MEAQMGAVISRFTRVFWAIFLAPVFMAVADATQSERAELEAKGVTFEAVYTGEVDSNLSGGIKRGTTYLGNFDAIMDVDTEKAGLWPGGQFHVYGLDNHGAKKLTGEIVGDLQTVSNIEAPRVFKLYELWYEHRFLGERFSVLMGLHDLNSEFAASSYGSLYINSSFGIQPDISANVPVSIFPVTAPAVRLKAKPHDSLEILAAVYDGDPQESGVNKHGAHFHLNSKQGVMAIGEIDLNYKVQFFESGLLPGTLKVGAWSHSGDADALTSVDDNGDPVRYKSNYGFYGILDQTVYCEKDEQGLGIFVQIGGSPDEKNDDRNLVDFYVGGGLNYHGLLPGRDEDDFGIAVASASISDRVRGVETRDENETTVEVTYRLKLNDSWSLQPDLQWVFNPGAEPSVKDAVVAGIRFEVGL